MSNSKQPPFDKGQGKDNNFSIYSEGVAFALKPIKAMPGYYFCLILFGEKGSGDKLKVMFMAQVRADHFKHRSEIYRATWEAYQLYSGCLTPFEQVYNGQPKVIHPQSISI